MDDNGQPRPPIILHSNYALAIIQRLAVELHQYCQQHPQNVDPKVCMGYIEEMASFVQHFATPMHQPGAKSPESIHGKAN